MKIRKDFVTNSSSSSYIIGKKDDNLTVQDVYEKIRQIYLKHFEKIDEVLKYIEENPNGKVVKKEYHNAYGVIECVAFHADVINGEEGAFRKERETRKWYEDTFQLPYHGLYDPKDRGWVNLPKYEEYVQYWENIKKTDESGEIRGPFTIYSFEDGNVPHWVHICSDLLNDPEYGKEYNTGVAEIGMDSDVLGYYMPYLQNAYEHLDNCEGCVDKQWCKREMKKECLKLKERLKVEKFNPEKACLFFLGKICVESESGFIPEDVVDELYDISEFACEHMG